MSKFWYSIAVAYLGFEIAGANKKFHRCFLDRFLYTVSYKLILSVIDLIEYTYQHERIFLFLEPNESKSPYLCKTFIADYFATFNIFFS